MINPNVSRSGSPRAPSPPTALEGRAKGDDRSARTPSDGGASPPSHSGTLSRAASPARLAQHVGRPSDSGFSSTGPKALLDLPIEIVAKILDGNHGERLENIYEFSKLSRSARRTAEFNSAANSHFKENFSEYDLLADAVVRRSIERTGSGGMESANSMLQRNSIFSSPDAKDHLRQLAVMVYMASSELQHAGKGPLLARASAYHGLNNPDAQQRAARDVLEMRSDRSTKEIDSWLLRADAQTGERPPHPVHGEIAHVGLQKPAFVENVLLNAFNETFDRLPHSQMRAAIIGLHNAPVLNSIPFIEEISSGHPKLKQFLLKNSAMKNLNSGRDAMTTSYGPSTTREALMSRALEAVKMQVRDQQIDKNWKGLSSVNDYAKEFTVKAKLDQWGDASPEHDAVVGMVNKILIENGKIDYADLARQGSAASRATVAHMFFDAIDTAMKPGNEHEPDWTDPKSLDTVHDKFTRDIEAKVGSDEDRSTLGLNDAAFGEQTRAKGLARLIQYEAITPKEIERSYLKEFMDKAR